MKHIIAKILKKDQLVIRKTDDELLRFKKLKLREKKLSNYIQKQKEEEKVIESKSAEIKKLQHMYRMQNLNMDRNELLVDWDFLHEKKNYTDKWLYLTPEYQNDKDFETSNKRRLWTLVSFIAAVGAGYAFGLRLSDEEDKRELLEEVLVEEQIYTHLIGSKEPG